jgi:hypothetical protein
MPLPFLDFKTIIAPKPRVQSGIGESESSLTNSLKVLLAKVEAVQQRDRRATPRVLQELVCEERRERGFYVRTTYDLSTFGLSTQTGMTRDPGSVIDLRLHLPDDLSKPLDLKAVVVGRNTTSGGMRLAFRNPPADAVRRIHRYLFANDPNLPETPQAHA